jgi:septal ring factor EnvC (AmiA/AmiB activator)
MEVVELLIAISGTGAVAALISRYKNKAERQQLAALIDQSEAETADKVNQMFSRLADDQREEIEALKADYKLLKSENIQLRTCYEEMKTAYEEIKAENIQLKDILANLEKHNDEYRQQAERRKNENIQLKAKLDRLDNSMRGLH